MKTLRSFGPHDRVAYLLWCWAVVVPANVKVIRLARGYGMGWPRIRRRIFESVIVHPFSWREWQDLRAVARLLRNPQPTTK